MNGLSLRISSGAKKTKETVNIPPVFITNHPTGSSSAVTEAFRQAATTDEQLLILKKVMDTDPLDPDGIKLLVVVFFHSAAKHPVKYFLTRHITKWKHLHEPFIQELSEEIKTQIKCNCFTLSNTELTYLDTVSRIALCLENFPPGNQAVQRIDKELAVYLGQCLFHAAYCLHPDRAHRTLSPSHKNVIYGVIHSILRLILHIVTKHSDPDDGDDRAHTHLVKELKFISTVPETLVILLRDKEVPMDTKSVCGLVTLALETYCHRYNPDVWKEFLCGPKSEELVDDQVKLAIYSAVVTAVPMASLQDVLELDGRPVALLFLIDKFMDIVERSWSDSVVIVGVSRAICVVCRGVGRVRRGVGLAATWRLLGAVCAHLTHYTDCVRHLAAQALHSLVLYTAQLEHSGEDSSALERVLSALRALGVDSRGYYAGVRGALRPLGAARVLRDVAPLPCVLRALASDHVAATAAVTLEELLARHCQETEAATIHREWVLPILHFVQTNDLEAEVLAILEKLLAKAVKLDPKLVPYILPHIMEACEGPARDLRNALCVLSVTRACLADKLCPRADTDHSKWRGVISYGVLERAVIDANDESRLLGLSLVACGAGGATRGELAVVLRYLRYNINAQAPHCRQRAIAMAKKFLKRVFDSHRAAIKSGDDVSSEMYAEFTETLRQLCYCGLQRGANYSRRCTALQLLSWAEATAHYQRSWELNNVERLLLTLDDSYETNKAIALDILQHVPLELLEDPSHSVSLQLEDIISQASALKHTECMSAGYKLELLWKRLPHRVLRGTTCEAKEPALYTILRELLRATNHYDPRWAWANATYDVLLAPRDRPTYGTLSCLAHLLDRTDFTAIREDSSWRELIVSIISTCQSMIEGASVVVNNAAPEGVMPPDCHYSDYGNNAGVTLADGRLVTAQMVLLCAWRTAKEATSVLGAIGALVDVPSTLCAVDLWGVAETLLRVVRSARHRGAFEQAYVAYERVLHRMWRDPSHEVRAEPSRLLKETVKWLRDPGPWGEACDRRSAGLPFLIQALVSTEPGAGGPGTGLRDVMTSLLTRASDAQHAAQRAHACNVLRALYRATSLDTAVQGYVGEGLRVAIHGFDGDTWEERNSSTLLLSALMTRVFGVSRARACVSARNKMTGRVFFLRYPRLYDVMLNKLKEVSESYNQLLCPSLYPVLLLLGRLYPSSLEGTESHFKLVSFVPYVVQCARSRVLLTRRLAAAAGVSLIPPDRYVSHLEYLLGLVSSARVERNFCHGILMQACALLHSKPAGVDCTPLTRCVCDTLWILSMAPMCYPVLQQYCLLLTLILKEIPEVLETDTLNVVEAKLKGLMCTSRATGVACGREPALAACWRLLATLLTWRAAAEDIADAVMSALTHDAQTVRHVALDHVLRLHGRDPDTYDPLADTSAHVMSAHEVTSDTAAESEALADEIKSNEVLPKLASNIAAGNETSANMASAHSMSATIASENDSIAHMASAKTSAENDSSAASLASAVLAALRRRNYMTLFADVKGRCPLETASRQIQLWRQEPQRAAKQVEVMVCEGDTQLVVGSCPPLTPPPPRELRGDGDGDVVDALASIVVAAPDYTAHLYLETLTSFLSRRVYDAEFDHRCLPRALAAVRARSAPSNPRECRAAVARLLPHVAALMAAIRHSPEDAHVESECLLICCVAELLQDEEAAIRAAAAAAVARLCRQTHGSVPTLAGTMLLEYCSSRPHNVELLTALALHRLHAAILPTDTRDTADELRVFDSQEQHNVHGESELWAAECARRVNAVCARPRRAVLGRLPRVPAAVHPDTADAVAAVAADPTIAAHPVLLAFVTTLHE